MHRSLPLSLLVPLLGCPSGGTTSLDGTTDCWQSDAMLDVSDAAGPGAGYGMPSLAAGCSDEHFVMEGNGLPTYEFVQMTPNPLDEQDYHFELPADPVLADAPEDIPLLGVVGIAVNGLVFYGPNEAAQPADSAWGDPVYNGITDGCTGHTANEYHFHALAERCLTQDAVADPTPWTRDAPDGSAASPIIGFAWDGFPIYGKWGCLDADCSEVAEMTSGYVQVGDPTRDAWDAYAFEASDDPTVLDECNGRVQPDGSYGYHATDGFPYIVGCFAGEPGELPSLGGP